MKPIIFVLILITITGCDSSNHNNIEKSFEQNRKYAQDKIINPEKKYEFTEPDTTYLIETPSKERINVRFIDLIEES